MPLLALSSPGGPGRLDRGLYSPEPSIDKPYAPREPVGKSYFERFLAAKSRSGRGFSPLFGSSSRSILRRFLLLYRLSSIEFHSSLPFCPPSPPRASAATALSRPGRMPRADAYGNSAKERVQRQRFCQSWLHVYVAQFMAKFGPDNLARLPPGRARPGSRRRAASLRWGGARGGRGVAPDALPAPQARRVGAGGRRKKRRLAARSVCSASFAVRKNPAWVP